MQQTCSKFHRVIHFTKPHLIVLSPDIFTLVFLFFFSAKKYFFYFIVKGRVELIKSDS